MSDSARHTHLFIYGTLLKSAAHPMGVVLKQHADVLAEGSIQARLYIIEEEDAQGYNSYPGAVPSAFAEDRVHGEVHLVSNPDPLFEAFNDFEACTPGWPEPYEFLLRPVDVTLVDGALLRAVSYLYTWDTSRATYVPSGRFTRASPQTR